MESSNQGTEDETNSRQ